MRLKAQFDKFIAKVAVIQIENKKYRSSAFDSYFIDKLVKIDGNEFVARSLAVNKDVVTAQIENSLDSGKILRADKKSSAKKIADYFF